MLTFRDTGKIIELKGDLLNLITNNNYNVDLASLSDKKSIYDFAKEIYLDVKATGIQYSRSRMLTNLLNSTDILVSASGVSKDSFSKTNFLSFDPKAICDRLKILSKKNKLVLNLIQLMEKFLLWQINF